MEDQNEKIVLQKNSRLPTIALVLGFAPIMLWLLGHIFGSLGYIFWILFFGSLWGIGFQVIGLILGLISLYILFWKRKMGIDLRGLIFSIVAILSPFIWVLTIWGLYRGGMEILL